MSTKIADFTNELVVADLTGVDDFYVYMQSTDGLTDYKVLKSELFEAIIDTSSSPAITAHAGGGQANATLITSKYNVITVCASTNDSVKLPSAVVGDVIFIQNNTATVSSTYPQSGEYMLQTLNVSHNINGNESAMYVCIKTGYWAATNGL